MIRRIRLAISNVTRRLSENIYLSSNGRKLQRPPANNGSAAHQPKLEMRPSNKTILKPNQSKISKSVAKQHDYESTPQGPAVVPLRANSSLPQNAIEFALPAVFTAGVQPVNETDIDYAAPAVNDRQNKIDDKDMQLAQKVVDAIVDTEKQHLSNQQLDIEHFLEKLQADDSVSIRFWDEAT